MLTRVLLPAVQVVDLKTFVHAADILDGNSIGADEFTLSVYPAIHACIYGTC